MKNPRHLLREYVIKKIIKSYPLGKFLEIGYGNGNMLVTLSRYTEFGAGYDFSEYAYEETNSLLKKKKIKNIRLIKNLDKKNKFDTILFLGVIGYFPDPVKNLIQYKNLLNDNGKIIFSFTHPRFYGDAEYFAGQMKCFTKKEMVAILKKSGLKSLLIWSYGFPLANMMKPFLDLSFYLKNKLFQKNRSITRVEAIKKSGLSHKSIVINALNLFINFFIYPFSVLQMLFKNTDWGVDYILVAQKIKKFKQ